MKSVLITGGTGFIGFHLAMTLLKRGDTVVVPTRDLKKGRRVFSIPQDIFQPGRRSGEWEVPSEKGSLILLEADPTSWGEWTGWIERVDVVVNLAGESVGARRWNSKVKEEIMRSRANATRNVVKAILKWGRKGQVLLNAGAIGYYGDRGDEELREEALPGRDFLSTVSVRWEEEVSPLLESPGFRAVIMRTGMVLSSSGGALMKMLPLFRLFLGGSMGSGRQWVSWITMRDLIGAIIFIMDTPALSGPVNMVAPEPVRFREFARTIGRTIHRPALLPIPSPVLKAIFGERGSLFLSSTRAIPGQLQTWGFHFIDADLKGALKAILAGGEGVPAGGD